MIGADENGETSVANSTHSGGSARRGGRAGEKRRLIIEAAERVFVRDGFAGASVDAIAAEAGVSKATIYAHFGNKETLFRSILRAILESRVDAFSAELNEHPDTPTDSEDADTIEGELLALGRRWARAILRPDVLALRRLVIGEMERFPELGRVWFEEGPGRVDRERARQFARFAEQGKLRLNDADLAAQHFGHLVIGPPQTMLLFKAREQLTDDEIEAYVRTGVAVFLSHYGVKTQS